MNLQYSLGVDLGTAYSAAAVLIDGTTTLVPLAGGATIPSVVHLDDTGEYSIGASAARRSVPSPGRAATGLKRRLGDPTPIMLGSAAHSAEQLTARLVQGIVGQVTDHQGSPPSAISFTHPAIWSPYTIDILAQAVRLAGVADATLVSDLAATAEHHRRTHGLAGGEIVVVYDLGAGSFDVGAFEMDGAGFVTRGAPDGVARLGGIDFDAAIMAHALATFGVDPAGIDPDDADWASATARLARDCVQAKEALSFDTEALIEGWLPTGRHELVLTRAEFEAMIDPALKDTIMATLRALQAAMVTNDAIHSFVLAGDSSRIPMVSRLISQTFGAAIMLDAQPKHQTALGAALSATTPSSRSPSSSRMQAPPPAPTPSTSPPVPPAEVEAERSADELVGLVTEVIGLAESQGRDDIAARVAQAAKSRSATRTRVVVCGDFKQGKSTLVNSLAETDLCPTDADIATGAPTTLTYGDTVRVQVHRLVNESGTGAEFDSIEIEPHELGEHVTEADERPEGFAAIHGCEVTVPTPWMRCGVELVDLPGAGGLDSPHGIRAATELMAADSAIFVTDASQELTQPELEFLQRCRQCCPDSVLVVSKIDLYPQWRRIRDINAGHLGHAGLDIDIVAISSVLASLGASTGDRSLIDESGIDQLRDRLISRVVADNERRADQELAQVLDEALAQMRSVVVAEQNSTDPDQAARTIRDLERSLVTVRDYFLPSAAWQRCLDDGVEDLKLRADDEMHRSIASTTEAAGNSIGSADPAEIWQDFQDWLRREASAMIARTYTTLNDATTELADEVAGLIAAAEGEVLIGAANPTDTTGLQAVSLAELDAVDAAVGRHRDTLEISMKGASLFAGAGAWIPGLGPFSLAIGAVAFLTYGRKAIRDRRESALAASRRHALDHTEDFLDETERLAKREVTRYVSTVYRQLRDATVQRLEQVQRSLEDAHDRAQANGRADRETLAARREELQTLADLIEGLTARNQATLVEPAEVAGV